ncbi:MAG: type II toxin-antitoxin system RelE/ParE family toxin [Bacteroidia bacterium]|nr:type II toxin-antitoxin system RelE/ParE family toxin [Bacteroidia bacterium]
MPYRIEYYHARVKKVIESWPVGILADYLRMIELLAEFGRELRMQHTRALGDGLFELRPRGAEGDGRAFYCYISGQRIVLVHAVMKKSEKTM